MCIRDSICASTGSACNSDSLDPSHVLLSIGVPEEIGHGSMRFTFGPQNTMEAVSYTPLDVYKRQIFRRLCYNKENMIQNLRRDP